MSAREPHGAGSSGMTDFQANGEPRGKAWVRHTHLAIRWPESRAERHCAFDGSHALESEETHDGLATATVLHQVPSRDAVACATFIVGPLLVSYSTFIGGCAFMHNLGERHP